MRRINFRILNRRIFSILYFQIGLMRGGVLLAEENPQQLMEKYESTDLEEIFFNLSVQQNTLSKTQVKFRFSYYIWKKG